MADCKGNLSRKEVEARVSAMIPRLHAICRSWGAAADVCDELVQETVVTALDKYAQLRDSQALESWTISILTNFHRMYLRQQRRETGLADDALVDELTPDNRLESAHTIAQVRKAISLLNDEHRKVLTLVDMEGMSYREVADVLNIRIGTVMSRLCRAREKLRVNLREILHIKETQQRSSVTKMRRLK
jgi:RNA polymerase sigma-70 factor (ECF subfamily)